MDAMQMVFGGLQRALQAGIEAAPTLLCGLFIAAVFSHMLGQRRTAKLFGEGTNQALLRAWIMGMLLPVCSLGVFPIIREMRRSGISGGTILAFALSGPLFNPLTFLYGLTLSEPMVIICFSFASLAVVTVAGLVWDRLFPHSAQTLAEEPPPIPYGFKRLLAVLLAAARNLVSSSMLYMLVALLGVGLLGAFIPFGSLESTMKHDDPLSPVIMSAVATPAYISPMRAMMQMGLLFEHGNSVGAGLTLLILGAGFNLGVIVWIWRTYTTKAMLAWVLLLVLTVLGISFGINKPLDFATNREGHTHAFDEFTNPFHHPLSASQYVGVIQGKLGEKMEVHEFVSLYALAGMAVLGLLVLGVERFWSWENWLRRQPVTADSDVNAPWWNRAIPSGALAGIALVSLIAFSVLGCYLYYPEEEAIFGQMRIYRVEVQSALLSYHPDKPQDHLQRMIPKLDDLSRKLEVSLFLRRWSLDPAIHELAEEYREALEHLRDEAREKTLKLDELQQRSAHLFQLHEALRKKVSE
jgi:uncharacterized protein